MRWIILVALVLAGLIGWIIKSGLMVHTGEESMVRPGKPVELYHEQVTSTYLRAKDTIHGIQQKANAEQDSWDNR